VRITRIGPLETGVSTTGLLVESPSPYDWRTVKAALPSSIARNGDALVALSNIEEADLTIFEPLAFGASIGRILSAWNFDPPEAHPDGFDFAWLSALVNDFRGINDDLDTTEGIRGGHFTCLLSWQPRINPERTALFAWITPGPDNEVAFRDEDAAPLLAELLAKHGYDAVFLSGYNEDAFEMETLTQFAEGMQRGADLPLILATYSEGAFAHAPFAMHFTRKVLPLWNVNNPT
jgi:hypothetical protein